jgi:hypothetical protein
MRASVIVIMVLFVATAAQADSFLVTLNTSPLSGPQTIAFGLTNFNAASNTVALSSFSFGGGSAAAGSEDCTLGGMFSGVGCSGNLGGGVTLEDLDPTVAFFTQKFNPGTSLAFVLTTTNSFAPGVPDQFAMSVCDAGLSTCYSDDATGAMLLLDLKGGSLSASSFVRIGASLQRLDPPIVSAGSPTSQVPEPSTLLLLAAGITAVVVRGRSRRV